MDERIINQIKSLLAKSKDKAATPSEAASAMHKVSKILTKHNLSLEDLGDIEKDVEDENVGMFPWNQRWQKVVWNSVAILNYCVFYTENFGTKPHVFHVVGRKINREVTKRVSSNLVDVCERLAREYAGNNPGNSVSLSNNFKKGFANEIARRAKEMAKEVLNENSSKDAKPTGTALAVVKLRKVTDEENKEHTLGLKVTSSKQQVTDARAVLAGRAEGRKASIHNPVGDK